MDDRMIIALYMERSERAIMLTAAKYGALCRSIALNILANPEDSEECVNDAYLRVWNAIPPAVPDCLKAFLVKIVRNLSLDRYKAINAKKRGGGQVELALEELRDMVASKDHPEQIVDNLVLTDALNHFLADLTKEKRQIFMRRYWYFSSIKEISADFRISESKVKMMLLRLRNELKKHLEQEGISV